jgi:hypothetical protein
MMVKRRRRVQWPSGINTDEWQTFDMFLVSGKGTAGRKRPESEARREEILKATGIDKVPGSLSLHSLRRVWVRRRSGVPWSRGLMYPGRVAGIKVVSFTTTNRLAARPRLIHVYADRHQRQHCR